MSNLVSLNQSLRFIYRIFLWCAFIYIQSIASPFLLGQESSIEGKRFKINEIIVTGDTAFGDHTVIAYSRLKKGEYVKLGGERIGNAIKKLWSSKLFGDVAIYFINIKEGQTDIEIHIDDLPELKTIKVEGIKERKIEELLKEADVKIGMKVTENLITTTKNYIVSKYQKKGFLYTKVNIITREIQDSIEKKHVKMLININKGKRVKVKSIQFSGSEKLKHSKLKKALKNTKIKQIYRFWKRSKYIEKDFNEDLVSLIDYYKENGYRDARIITDSIHEIDEKNIDVFMKIEEGEQYKFGEINFVGNTVFSDAYLKNIMKIDKGTTYNGVELRKRIADDSRPDANDLTNLYQNNGYLFSNINPVEVKADGQVIDMEIRITEGKPTYFDKVTVNGNEVTNDHVIYRQIRTLPGNLYSKANVVRTVRELGQTGYFDAQQITPDFLNPNPVDGTLDFDYKVVEQGSSQIELQGGYGGGGFIGTLGLSFKNFSIKDIFKGKEYRPVPRGDGQTFALRLQASRFFQTYSLSFSEPWLGGRKPFQFSTSVSYSRQFQFNFNTRRVDKNQSFDIFNLTIGTATRLKKPDDYFQFSQAITFQNYNINNYSSNLFAFSDGNSNNLAFSLGLSRDNTNVDPIYPTGGSAFSLLAKFSLPYSLFNNVDYTALRNERDGLNDSNQDDRLRIAEIDQERFKWLEYYKINFNGQWFTQLAKNLVLRPRIEFGFLGAYNQDRGIIPFERFSVGGSGLANFSLDGREFIQLRGYEDRSLTDNDGASIYNKFSLELRYPITLGQQAKIFALTFAEGGSVSNSFKDFDPFNLKRSAGVGLRIFMQAIGLLGIDFGYGFDDSLISQGRSGWQTHFIFGQQF